MNDQAGGSTEEMALREQRMIRLREHNAREVTRLLCAQAYLGGAGFRASVLGFYARNDDAVAPELGVDARLVVQACLAARRADRAYDLVFSCIALLGLVAWLMGMGSLLPMLALLAVLAYVVRQLGINRLLVHFTKTGFDYQACRQRYAGVPIPPAIDAALPRPDQNLLMYCNLMPFVGAGNLDGGWSFNCALDRAESGHVITPFTVRELYAHVEAALDRLRLPGLECEHQLFVRGSEVRNQAELFTPGDMRPLQRISDEWVRTCMDGCDERMRHYLCIRISDWGGEVVTSFYLRFVVQGNGLYVESNRFFLGPLREEFRAIDKWPLPTLSGRIEALARALFLGPVAAVLGVFFAVGGVFRALDDRSRRRHRRSRLAREANYNFGASSSLRMMVSATTFQNFFQLSDVDFNRKLIERNLLDEIGNFLQAHGIDDSDIRDRRATILNNGVLVQGGNVQAGALAVGTGAKASTGAANEGAAGRTASAARA